MTLDRGIAAIFLVICIVYGYTAFVTMQDELLPFEMNMAFLPNTMPKVLSVVGAIVALVILVTSGSGGDTTGQLDFSKLKWPHIAQAVGLLVAMVAYALLLRPLGFIASTSLFLICSSVLLGERKFQVLIPVALIAAFAIWFLVERLLDIVLKPWPWFISA